MKKSKQRRAKSPKGTCGYHVCKGVYRLQWWCPIQQRRRYASTGHRVSDGLMAENLAKSRAQLISNDLISENYDVTLAKYFPDRPVPGAAAPKLTVQGLIDKWLNYKKSKVCDRTYRKYQVTLKHLRNGAGHLLMMSACNVGEGHADDVSAFIDGLGIGPAQRKRHIETLKAAWCEFRKV